MPPACPSEELTNETVRFRSGLWLLEGEMAYTDSAPRAAAVIAGPHPLLGGTMENNVVRGLGDGLARRGVVTLRFDYRGAGASEGPVADAATRLAQFWECSRVADEAEYQEDVTDAASFLRRAVAPVRPVALVGYSFGCSLLAGAAGVDATTPLVLVAPTVGTHAYESFAASLAPKLVIAPEDDFAASAERVREWFGYVAEPKRLLRPRLDGHFFRGHEDWLAEVVSDFLCGDGA